MTDTPPINADQFDGPTSDNIRGTPNPEHEETDRKQGSDTKILREETIYITSPNNSIILLQWRDGAYSVHTRLPDLDGLGMRDAYFEFSEAGCREAVQLYEQRLAVLECLTTVRTWKGDTNAGM